ncbi:histidine phosphatase family protein [Mycolicibacterium neoaurum]|uniref:histidine phosphatase family protein n=1 Tax=Mycolicibacterium neoaurum TaxID=1795 RepID=UPI002673D05C|nr:histidine phosphatase family protein [Mycolicibacterium neoaurum]MDO3401593.1 histidine phosphatase family protein [Mycolicibacterium neoaurum]
MHLVDPYPAPARWVWVVRHGESTWNAIGRMQRQVGHPPLTAKGIEQAYAAGFALRDRDVARVISSDAIRARQTAQAIATVLEVEIAVDPRLRERGWNTTGPIAADSAVPPRLEDPTARVTRIVEEIAALPGATVVVTHGDIVCLMLDMLRARTAENAHWGDGLAVPNGAVIPMRLDRRSGIRSR